jgi:hypothetical protein
MLIELVGGSNDGLRVEVPHDSCSSWRVLANKKVDFVIYTDGRAVMYDPPKTDTYMRSGHQTQDGAEIFTLA